MDINQESINQFLNKYIDFTNKLALDKNYEDNIKHVLYLIIPAFVLKYGFRSEQTILKCFSETRIIISPKEDNVCTAYYTRQVEKNIELNNYYTKKFVILNKYHGVGITELMDNIVHEFNHAVNSMINEIKFDDDIIYVRTGISYLKYKRANPKEFIEKTPDVTLEEIINTRQTEIILDLINNFGNFSIDNMEFSNTLYTIKHEISANAYKSSAYFFQSYICKELIGNKTFIPTMENLRFQGNVDDIPGWFDNITGEDGSYKKLTMLLEDILRLEEEYTKAKWFKKRKLYKIKERTNGLLDIIKTFENNCIYK